MSLAVAKGEWEHWPARVGVSPFVSLAVVVGVAARDCVSLIGLACKGFCKGWCVPGV